MSDEAERLASDIQSTMGGITALSDVADADTLTLDLRLFSHPRNDTRGVAVQAAWMPTDTVEAVCNAAEERVDLRRAEKGKTLNIGSVTITGAGEIEAIDIDTDYLKPSKV